MPNPDISTGGRRPAKKLDELLPEPARAKLRALRLRRDDTLALVRKDSENVERLRAELSRLKSRRIEIESSGSWLPYQKKGALKQIDDELQLVEKDFERALEVRDPRAAKREHLAHLLSAIENWIERLPAEARITAAGRPTREKTSKVKLEDLETIRRRIRERQADFRAATAAPIHSSEAKQLAKVQIEELASMGAPDCFRLIESGGQIEWPTTPPQLSTFDASGVSFAVMGEVSNDVALLAWLFKETLVSRIELEIDASADDEHALSTEQRAETLAACRRDCLAYEREEEALVEHAEANGLEILRRVDADPRAILGLSDELPAA